MKLPANLTKSLNGLSAKMGKAGLKLKKHAPELMTAGSIVTGIAATVMACKATLETNDLLDRAKADIDALKEYKANVEVDEQEYKKSLTKVYVNTGIEMAKAYAPAIILGGLSIGGVIGSNKIYRERNASLAAAYAAVDQAYKKYRQNVIEQFGEDVDKQAKYCLETKEFEDEKGKKHKEQVSTIDGYSEYSRFFDSSCAEWTKSPEYNMSYLLCRQSQANDMLRSRGFLFLNDVYNMLGIMPSKAGQQVGWIFDENNPVGDNYVDFGIFETKREKSRDFVNGYEPVILLDFNVDGPILNYLN